MREETVLRRLAQKLRIPANIVYIVFPMLCLALLVFRWSGFWLTEPWTAAVIIFYYVLAVAYLLFIVITRMRVIAIIGLFLTLVTSLFMWIPFNWVLAILLVPAVFMAFYNRGSKETAVVFSLLLGLSVLGIILSPFKSILPERIAYHQSPDGKYVALEHEYQWLFFGGTDVLLCRVNGPFLISDRVLYLGDNIDFGGNIEWLDENNMRIYGEVMDVFKDPAIERYTPF